MPTKTKPSFNASNKPGTCLYCGAKLAAAHEHLAEAIEHNQIKPKTEAYFCSDACAVAFATKAASKAIRLRRMSANGRAWATSSDRPSFRHTNPQGVR